MVTKNNYLAHNSRVVDYDNLGQYQLAIEDFNKAISLKENYADAYNNRADAYLHQGGKELGCYDAQTACALGLCKALEWAKGNGLCR